jgi:hypothetical protein
VVGYPAWWPEVTEARTLGADHVWLRTRSILPYELAFDLARTIANPLGGVLEARLSGDLGASSAGPSSRPATGAVSRSTRTWSRTRRR